MSDVMQVRKCTWSGVRVMTSLGVPTLSSERLEVEVESATGVVEVPPVSVRFRVTYRVWRPKGKDGSGL